MLLTKDNLTQLEFENEIAKILFSQVISNQAVIELFENIVITEKMAMDIWLEFYK